jgi:phosphoribosylaminoimidazole (AIR) synthetase
MPELAVDRPPTEAVRIVQWFVLPPKANAVEFLEQAVSGLGNAARDHGAVMVGGESSIGPMRPGDDDDDAT